VKRLEFSVGQQVGIFTVTRSNRPLLPSGQRAVWVRCPKCNREFFNRVESLRSAKSCGTADCKGSRWGPDKPKAEKQTVNRRKAPTRKKVSVVKKPVKVPEVAAPGRWNTLEAEAKLAFASDLHYVEDMARAWHAMLANRELREERKRRVG